MNFLEIQLLSAAAQPRLSPTAHSVGDAHLRPGERNVMSTCVSGPRGRGEEQLASRTDFVTDALLRCMSGDITKDPPMNSLCVS